MTLAVLLDTGKQSNECKSRLHFLQHCVSEFSGHVSDPENMTEIQILLQGLGWGSRVCISSRLLTNADATQLEQKNSREFIGEAMEE